MYISTRLNVPRPQRIYPARTTSHFRPRNRLTPTENTRLSPFLGALAILRPKSTPAGVINATNDSATILSSIQGSMTLQPRCLSTLQRAGSGTTSVFHARFKGSTISSA
ncbi:hypothetical protein SCLCIDRAFT_1224812 [Scleroderma citrinum Foug A]|uniref:Uncharacterized protein n=1 Tax=Scleroderma citrinum Foug A TaxID=1036808 RepID=A0A0C2ZDZ7_9AGAM|nr:hypothetical protein SCLCIDRAFT_1224812 [Scleroderma citrinum Foug A]